MPTVLDVDTTARVYSATMERPTQVYPTEVKHITSRYNEAAQLSVTALASLDPPREIGPEANPLLDEETQLDYLMRHLDTHDYSTIELYISGEKVGEGTIGDVGRTDDGLLEIVAFDNVRVLTQSSHSATYQDASVHRIITDAFRSAGLTDADVEMEFETGTQTGTDDDGRGGPTEGLDEVVSDLSGVYLKPYRLTREFSEESCARVLDIACRSADWQWWVDVEDVVHVSDTLPTEQHDLDYVLDTSAGKQRAPYQRVVVQGGTNTSTGAAPHQLSRDPVRASAGQGEPVYTYTDRSIRTQAEAQAVADSIMKEFRRQQSSGWVKAVGNNEIRPLDVVRMPDHLGGERYFVSSVEHSINSTDGYTTRVQVGFWLGEDPGEGSTGSDTPDEQPAPL